METCISFPCRKPAIIKGLCISCAEKKIEELCEQNMILRQQNDQFRDDAQKGIIPQYEKRIKELSEEVKYWQDISSGESPIPPNHLANQWYGE